MQRQWWQGKTAYQIYPKSFCDSNGDGIGDIPGIISKLDELQELGVEILWLSPVYCSPMADQGYDISDYYNIDPRFGTMEDMDRLIAEGKKRGMSIVMDLVVNHCSDEHEWFRKACEDPDGPYGQYFYIRPWHEGEKLPNNWRSYFGGSVWEKLPGHDDRVYLHLFHKKQPDLNWENPVLREEIYKMVNWWLDKGVAGFRIDAIINIKKPIPLTVDYPADRPDGLCSAHRMLQDAVGLTDMLNELADRTFRPHNAFTIAELFDWRREDLERYIGDHGCFDSIFDFAETVLNGSQKGWYDQKPVTPEQYKQTVFGVQREVADIGYMANVIENHDEPRGVSRYLPEGECSPEAKKMLGGLSFMLRGLPFLYQGQELGLENVQFTDIAQVDDISTKDEYQVALNAGCTKEEALKAINRYSRDHARLPYPWSDAPQGGFTTGTPWLMVNPAYPVLNLAAEKQDENSVWHFYRKLIQLRKNPEYHETVVYGAFEAYLEDQHNLMAYFRKGDKTLLVAGNYQPQPQTMKLPASIRKVLVNNLPTLEEKDGSVVLAGYQFLVLEI